MEKVRNILLGILFGLAFMLWSIWQTEHAASSAATQPAIKNEPVTAASTAGLPQVPGATNTNQQLSQELAPPSRLISIKTDVLNVAIDKLGGNIVKVSFPHYPAALHSNDPFTLLTDEPSRFYEAQSGLVSTVGPDSLQQQALYTSTNSYYKLSPDKKELIVTLTWKSPQGITINKNFLFKQGQYVVDVTYAIENPTTQPWSGYFYAQLLRKDVTENNKGLFQINPYVGGVLSSPDKRYEKIDFATMNKQDLNKDIKDGWAAMSQHYFLSAWIPDENQTYNYSTKALPDKVYLIRLVGPIMNVAPSNKATVTTKFYAGPAVVDQLKGVAPGLDLTVDYGILWPIAIAIFWLMDHIHAIFGNWGIAIILVTVVIKLLFYQLSASSYRSMAAMRKLQPKLIALKERYGDDRQKMSQATMELYRKEKVNPLGGCLPILVQIPVFIALYWVLLESVELRHAPFMLWIQDLSAPDRYYVLPIIMGITIFLQQKMNPAPMDPLQAKIMLIMPVFFTVLFINFPSGLVLYWVANNILSIIQQWYITRSIENSEKKGENYKKTKS